jgi:hypothetical protein
MNCASHLLGLHQKQLRHIMAWFEKNCLLKLQPLPGKGRKGSVYPSAEH